MNCPNCDREDCDVEAAQRAANERDRWLTRDELIEFREARVRLLKAVDDCSAHRVDWRARARAAEARVLTAEELRAIGDAACVLEIYPEHDAESDSLRAIVARLEEK